MTDGFLRVVVFGYAVLLEIREVCRETVASNGPNPNDTHARTFAAWATKRTVIRMSQLCVALWGDVPDGLVPWRFETGAAFHECIARSLITASWEAMEPQAC